MKKAVTILELIYVTIVIGAISLIGGAIYVAIHFITKFW